MGWETYVTARGMLGFGGCADLCHENHHSPTLEDKSSQGGRAIQSQVLEQPNSYQTTNQNEFGHPSPRNPQFKELILIPEPAPILPTKRTLEDVLRDYPEKQFKGFDQNSLNLTAKTVLQVTDEVILHWVRRWCPRMNFTDVFDRIRPEGSAEEPRAGEIRVVPIEALDLKGFSITLANLFRRCHTVRPKHADLRLVDVVEIIDRCIIICVVIKDEIRKSPLVELKKMLQWLPIGLDCKRLEALRGARAQLRKANTCFGDEKEKEILDDALCIYEWHRETFRIELLKQLKAFLDLNPVIKDYKGCDKVPAATVH
ncbi:hypothetical protein AAE478_001774 [Parahypoxylon ruwenzoriense]